MTNSETLAILRKEAGCRKTENSCVGKLCMNCEYNVTYDDMTRAIDTAIEAVELLVSMEDDHK